MDLQKLSLNSIHKNGTDLYVVEERMDDHDTIYVKLKKQEVVDPELLIE